MTTTGYNKPENGKFTLIAHSLGCYICCNFAIKHHDLVKEMILISPAAVNGAPDKFDPQEWIKNRSTTVLKYCFKAFYFVWDFHLSPVAPAKVLGYYIGNNIYKSWLTRIKPPTQADKDAYALLQRQSCLRQKTSADRCMSVIFAFGLHARIPLERFWRDKDCPLRQTKCIFLYGANDSMDRKYADALKKEGCLAKGSVIYSISNADHHLYINNPEETLKRIKENVS